VDWQDVGLLEDDALYELMVYPLPKGVRLTAVIDCHRHHCTFDLPFEYEHASASLVCTNPVDIIRGDVLLFSGCTGTHLHPSSPRRCLRPDPDKSPLLQAFIHARQHASHTPPQVLDIVQGMRAYVGQCPVAPTLSGSKSYTLSQPFQP
jgi:hypothetical protein